MRTNLKKITANLLGWYCLFIFFQSLFLAIEKLNNRNWSFLGWCGWLDPHTCEPPGELAWFAGRHLVETIGMAIMFPWALSMTSRLRIGDLTLPNHLVLLLSLLLSTLCWILTKKILSRLHKRLEGSGVTEQ